MSTSSTYIPVLFSSPEWAINPPRAVLNYANSVANPEYPDWALSILALFMIMRIGFILVCGGIMLIPVFKGNESRRRHFYLVHMVYPEGARNSMPYLVPNRCMIIVVCELLTSVLYMISAYFNYSFSTNIEKQAGPRNLLLIWFVIAWLPSYLGMVMATWGLCYACLCDVEGTKNQKYSRILTPIVYNSIWITWSLVAIGVISYWAIRSLRVMTRLEDDLHQTLAVLKTASNSWDAYHNLGKIPLQTFLDHISSVLGDWRRAESTVAGFTITWIVLASALAFFYIFVVCVLLHMLKQVLRMREADAMTVDAKWSSAILRELQEEFQFLFRSSFVIVLSICAQICEAFIMNLVSGHLDSISWRVAGSIVCQIPGVFMVPALLLQSWRIFTERSADESEFCRVPLNSVTKGIPRLTTQLLGWDTTVYWKHERHVEEESFPGLRPISLSKISVCGKSMASSPEDLSSDCIQITRSTVISRDVI